MVHLIRLSGIYTDLHFLNVARPGFEDIMIPLWTSWMES